MDIVVANFNYEDYKYLYELYEDEYNDKFDMLDNSIQFLINLHRFVNFNLELTSFLDGYFNSETVLKYYEDIILKSTNSINLINPINPKIISARELFYIAVKLYQTHNYSQSINSFKLAETIWLLFVVDFN